MRQIAEQKMYIHRLSIRNLRSIAKEVIKFESPQNGTGNITLLLGGNGAGKTSILRAVALSCLGPTLAESGFLPYRLVRESARSSDKKPALCELTADIQLTKQDGAEVFSAENHVELSTNIERWGKGI